MAYPIFYVPAGDVLPILFASYDKDDGSSITLTGLAATDVEIYKDGSVTQRASDAGFTLLDTDGIDFDGITGIHGFSIDTGDNTDSGFYTVGSWFHVVVSAVTIDAVAVSFIAAAFRIMKAESIAGVPKADVDAWLGTAAATPTVAGVPEVDLTHVGGATTNVAALATNVDAILTDTADMQPKLGTPADLGSGATLGKNLEDVFTAQGDAATSLLTLVNSMKGLAGFGQSTIGGTGNDTTHVHLSGMTYGDDEINSHLLVIYDVSTDEYHARWITDWVLSTELATVATLPFTPQASTDKYWILSLRNDVTASGDSSGVTTLLSRLGTPSDLGGGATVAANLADIEAQTDDIGVAGAGLTALATQASVNTIDDLLDTEIPALTTAVADLPTNAELATALGTADDAVLAAIAALQLFVDTEVAAILADTNELQTDWVNGGRLDLLIDGIKAKTDSLTFTVANQVDANAVAVSGDATAADRLEALMDGTLVGTVNDAGATTTVFICAGFTPGANDRINGRLLTFTSGALAGEQTDITDWVEGTSTITVTALTAAPANGVSFVIS